MFQPAQLLAILHDMNAAKTTAERVAKLRADRDALGLKRLELYAHPEDWPAIKALAEKLQRKRAKLAGRLPANVGAKLETTAAPK
jgi:hypothetical protein